MNLEISLSPESVFHLGSWVVSNSVLTGWVLTVLLLVSAFLVRRRLQTIPGRLQVALEMVYSWLLDLTETIIGRRDVAQEILPYVFTLFVFILSSNWFGLLPGVSAWGFIHHTADGASIVPILRSPTNDLNTVLMLAMISMGYVQYLGLKYAGPKVYFGKFLSFKSPLSFFVGLLELLSEFTRLISFTFRLFGNVFAGEVLTMVILFLTITMVPYLVILPAPFLVLELFISAVQAFIFCILTIMFVSLAVADHDESAHEPLGEELTLITK